MAPVYCFIDGALAKIMSIKSCGKAQPDQQIALWCGFLHSLRSPQNKQGAAKKYDDKLTYCYASDEIGVKPRLN